MIYQSGYLTIKAYDKEVCLYTLQFPNDEVCYGFLNFLVPFYTKVTDDETGFHIAKFMRELKRGMWRRLWSVLRYSSPVFRTS